jgi:hypothetical protein
VRYYYTLCPSNVSNIYKKHSKSKLVVSIKVFDSSSYCGIISNELGIICQRLRAITMAFL